jgi:hypothetical protein
MKQDIKELEINGVTYVPKGSEVSVATGPRGPVVLVRTIGAGVHVGELLEQNGQVVKLADAHRIWRWRGANTLSELSRVGASTKDHTRISERVTEITLLTAIEVIPCTPDAAANLRTPRWL